MMLAGCETVRPCRTQTLLVTITLEASLVNADQLLVGISIDGATPATTLLNHVAGESHGTVEIDFGSGYPLGREVTISVAATAGGMPVGHGMTTVTAPDDCGTPTVDVIP